MNRGEMQEKRTALILGASGLVGGRCLHLLLKEGRCEKVVALGRRRLGIDHPKLVQIVADLAHPEQLDLPRIDDVYSCLGTTRAKTPSEAEYRKIDLELPLAVAKLALDRGAQRFLLVSSVGADARSPFFYPRIKGELEDAIRALPFQAAHLFRPSFLLGERGESRPGEAAMLKLAPLWSVLCVGPLRKYRCIDAELVARAMVRSAFSTERGVRRPEYDAIAALGL